MDTAGVLVGPLLAYWILASLPGRFDAIFVVSFAVALIGIAVLVLLVDDRRGAAVAALTSFVVVSDAFLYLLIQWRRGGGAETIPLLYAGTASAYLVLAAPLGRLADRVGRVRMFLIGQALMVAVFAGIAWIGIELWTLALCLLLHGAYYAATDGVLAALASSATRSDVRASGLAALTTATSLARLAGSVVVGVVWSWRGPETVVTLALIATAAALIVSAVTLKGASLDTLDAGTT